MPSRSPQAAVWFSCVGHSFVHLFGPIYYVVALALEREMGLPYEEVIALAIVGNLMMGAAALPAGLLGDRWSAVGMMSLFFLGTGTAAILTGLARTPFEVLVGYGLIGLFGSIYHPVGIAWLVRNAVNRGKALGLNGLFGGIGPAVAALVAGVLTDLWSWRAAFIVPGAICLVIGVAFVALVRRGAIVETKVDVRPNPATARSDMVRASMILGLTMICSGLVYQATQVGMPKLFEMRTADLTNGGILGVGGMVTLVYLVAGLFQLYAGHLADRHSPKALYLLTYAVQVPLLAAAASLSGLPLLAVAVLMVTLNTAAIPSENILLARYTPEKWRGTAYGIKFVLSFGVSSLSVPMVALFYGKTGGFGLLFVTLAGLALVVALAATLLPGQRSTPAPVAAE